MTAIINNHQLVIKENKRDIFIFNGNEIKETIIIIGIVEIPKPSINTEALNVYPVLREAIKAE